MLLQTSDVKTNRVAQGDISEQLNIKQKRHLIEHFSFNLHPPNVQSQMTCQLSITYYISTCWNLGRSQWPQAQWQWNKDMAIGFFKNQVWDIIWNVLYSNCFTNCPAEFEYDMEKTCSILEMKIFLNYANVCIS